MNMIRFIANGVPSNSTIGGKNSEIDGAWNPPSSAARAGRRVAASGFSTSSSFRFAARRTAVADAFSPYRTASPSRKLSGFLAEHP
jgi:hypothetical protein